MQNLKLNVHNHMSHAQMKALFHAFSTIEETYMAHVDDLYANHEQTDAVKKEIKRAIRAMNRARDTALAWGTRSLTKKGEEIHGRDGNYFDNDYI